MLNFVHTLGATKREFKGKGELLPPSLPTQVPPKEPAQRYLTLVFLTKISTPEGGISSNYKVEPGALQTSAPLVTTGASLGVVATGVSLGVAAASGASLGAAAASAAGSAGLSRLGELAANSAASSSATCAASEASAPVSSSATATTAAASMGTGVD
jgi:hypothetical protein